ncbi:MAG: GNAT family N-acetyltransferase [Pseudomonadota bacterium]
MTPTLTLCPAEPHDSAAMGAILSDWIDTTDWMPRLYSRAQDQAFCETLVETTTLVKANGEIKGFLTRDGAEISALYIARGAHRQGLGTALLKRAKSEVSELRLWTFTANTSAQAFYAKHGFVQTDQTSGDNAENLPDLQLTWERKL